MTLTPITDEKEIYQAYKKYNKAVNGAGKKRQRKIGTRAGIDNIRITWHPKYQIYSYFTVLPDDATRFWCVFGKVTQEEMDNPTQVHYVTCEINPPVKGINRRVGGVLVKDNSGNIYIAHRGKIGGGRKGISKTAFWNHYKGSKDQTITHPDGKEDRAVIIGRLDDKHLVGKIAIFVNEVHRIKNLIVGAPDSEGIIEDVFNPEFSGQRESYTQQDIILSECNHGIIVNELESVLRDSGHMTGNQGNADLYITDGKNRKTHLFEVKTNISTSSIYQAIGQLFFYGYSQPPVPELILVIPNKPEPRTMKVLSKINIKVLTYRLNGVKVDFQSLSSVLSNS